MSMEASIGRKAPELHWWVAFAAVLALAAPFIVPWAFFVQVAVAVFAVFALFRVKSRVARVVVIVALVLVCLPIVVQSAGAIAASSLDTTFEDKAVPVG